MLGKYQCEGYGQPEKSVRSFQVILICYNFLNARDIPGKNIFFPVFLFSNCYSIIFQALAAPNEVLKSRAIIN